MESCYMNKWNAVLFLLSLSVPVNEHYSGLPAELQGKSLSGGPVQVLGFRLREQIQHGHTEMHMNHIYLRRVQHCLGLPENKSTTSPKSDITHATEVRIRMQNPLLYLELMTGRWRCFLTTRGASISCRKVCMLMVWSGFLMGVLGHGSDRLDTALQCRNHRCACEEEGSTTLWRTTEDSFESHSTSRRI